MNYSSRVALGVKDCHLELNEIHFNDLAKNPKTKNRADYKL